MNTDVQAARLCLGTISVRPTGSGCLACKARSLAFKRQFHETRI